MTLANSLRMDLQSALRDAIRQLKNLDVGTVEYLNATRSIRELTEILSQDED